VEAKINPIFLKTEIAIKIVSLVSYYFQTESNGYKEQKREKKVLNWKKQNKMRRF